MALFKRLNLKNVSKFNVVFSIAVGLLVAIAGIYLISGRAATGAATISLSPGTYYVSPGSNFTVNIRVDSGTNPINAVQANLTYPDTKLEFINLDYTDTAFPVAAESFGENGSIRVARGASGGQSVTGDKLLAKITFKSLMNSGSATVSFASGTAVVSSIDNTELILTANSGTYAPDSSAPTAPSNLASSQITGNSIGLAWSASTDNVGVAEYNIYRDNVKIATSTTTSYSNTGLNQGTTYQYQVSASDAAGNESAKSNLITATTLDTTAPSVPAGLSLQALTHDQIRVTWNASTDTGGSGLAGYRVYRGSSPTPVGITTSTTFTDINLTGNTSYSYRVAAYDNAGNQSAKSTSASATTLPPPDTTPPSQPANLRVTERTLSTINLAWDASTDANGVNGYRVYRDGSLIGSPVSTTYDDFSLNHGTSYTYTVKAIDPSGNLSTAASLTTSTHTLKMGDINRDNLVDIYDLSLLVSKWHSTNPADSAADLDSSGRVDIFDLSRLLTYWGT